MSKVKSLVIVCGQLGATKITWPNFKKNILDTLDPDLMIVGCYNDYNKNDPYYIKAKYKYLLKLYKKFI